MRISTTHTANGTLYRIYKGESAWEIHFNLLLTLIQEREFKVCVGGADEDARIVLTIGPLSGLTDDVFRLHLEEVLGA